METGSSSKKKKQQQKQQHDLDLEKVRLISLALEFGFDEHSANQSFDRLLALYGMLHTLINRFTFISTLLTN